jgi:anti-sigma factor RsiW
MHNHDLDLIASLADGSLDDQTEARALVATCPQCRQEYESQTSILEALSGIEPALMTDLEKAALHRDLWTELRGEHAGRAATPWWYRWSYAAAALFVMVGLVAVLNQNGLGDEVSETFSEVSSGLDGGGSAESVTPLYSPQMDESGSETSTTIAAATDSGAGTTVPTVESAATDFKTVADEARLGQLPPTDRALLTERAACLGAAGLEDYEFKGAVEEERTYLIAVPAGVDLDSETPITFVDADTCEVVHVEE